MAAKYPEVFVFPHSGKNINYNEAFNDPRYEHQVSNYSCIRLKDMLQGASFKIEPGLQKTMNRGQQRTFSEKISLEIKLAFIDKARYEKARSWINKSLDMIWYDPEDPTGMVTIFKQINLSVKGELEGGDGYVVTLGVDREVCTGAGVIMESRPDLRLINFYIKDKFGEPVRGMIEREDYGMRVYANSDGLVSLLLDFAGDWASPLVIAAQETGSYTPTFLDAELISPQHEHTFHITLTPVEP